MKLLLEAGQKLVDVNSKDDSGGTPLSFASKRGHATVVRLLLAAGRNVVNVDSKDEYGTTPLSYASGRGREVVVKLPLATSRSTSVQKIYPL